ncbi:MAG: type II toxin-antitoxin system VapC family toxin [Rhizomicrobium sp.]
MTTDKVVDASAIAAILFDEAERDLVVVRIEAFTLHAPFLLEHEIANVCIKKMKRLPAEADRYILAANSLRHFDIRFHRIATPAVAILALRSGLSAYDASYLWLARELGAELVTLDKRLEQAAQS